MGVIYFFNSDKVVNTNNWITAYLNLKLREGFNETNYGLLWPNNHKINGNFR